MPCWMPSCGCVPPRPEGVPPLTPAARQYLRRLPKAELHVHLEGSMQPARMLEFSHKHFGGAPWNDTTEVEQWFEYRDFAEFLNIFARVCMCLQTPDDFRVLARDYFAAAAAQGVVYAELMVSPNVHRGRGINIADMARAIGDAQAEARDRYGVESGLIFDISRQMPIEEGWETVRDAIALQESGVVGIGLGGNEPDFPPELFAGHFAAAKSEGLGLCAHAGEWAGPKSIRGAMDALGATRLGHGTAVREDPALLEEIRQRGIMLDMCPISNARTQSIEALRDHPIGACLDAGVAVSLNSDDPTLFQTTILGEYEALYETFEVPAERLARLGPDAMGWSFADAATRERVVARMGEFRDDLV